MQAILSPLAIKKHIYEVSLGLEEWMSNLATQV
jgi:hypothetical protein